MTLGRTRNSGEHGQGHPRRSPPRLFPAMVEKKPSWWQKTQAVRKRRKAVCPCPSCRPAQRGEPSTASLTKAPAPAKQPSPLARNHPSPFGRNRTAPLGRSHPALLGRVSPRCWTAIVGAPLGRNRTAPCGGSPSAASARNCSLHSAENSPLPSAENAAIYWPENSPRRSARSYPVFMTRCFWPRSSALG